MDTKKFIKLIQEVVRNEVRTVLREELSKQSIKENYNPTIESIKKIQKPKPTGDSLKDILNETAYEGSWRNMGTFTSADALTFSHQQALMSEYRGNQPVHNVQSFIQANNNGAQDIRQVQVNAVPDFSNMMKTMKNKGMI